MVEAFSENLVKPSVDALVGLCSNLLPWHGLGPCRRQRLVRCIPILEPVDIKALAQTLSSVPSSSRPPWLGSRDGPLEGIWLGGKRGQLMDNLDEFDFVEVDCRE